MGRGKCTGFNQLSFNMKPHHTCCDGVIRAQGNGYRHHGLSLFRPIAKKVVKPRRLVRASGPFLVYTRRSLHPDENGTLIVLRDDKPGSSWVRSPHQSLTSATSHTERAISLGPRYLQMPASFWVIRCPSCHTSGVDQGLAGPMTTCRVIDIISPAHIDILTHQLFASVLYEIMHLCMADRRYILRSYITL